MKLLIVIFLSCLAACSVPNRISSNTIAGKNIIYVLRDTISNLFGNKVNDSSFFCLYSGSNYYDLYIAAGSNTFARITNRRIFIKGKTYPIFFDYDMYLGTITPEEDLIKQYRAGQYLETIKSITIAEGFFVRFSKSSQKVINSGNALAKPLTEK